MKRIAYCILSTSLLLACAELSYAQGPVDSAIRERERERQRNYEDPGYREKTVEQSPPLKRPTLPPLSPVRAIVDLQIVGIVDGDTVVVSNTANRHLRVRLQGIDAPEQGQVFCDTAMENLSKLVSGKSVSVEFDPRGKPDKEGRIVAKVYLDGDDIALEQIRAGLAWYSKNYKKDQTESDRHVYADVEEEARKAGRGLWREPSPLAPWKFRQTP